MTSAAKQYTGEINKHFRFLPTWPIGYPIAVGDIGTIDADGAWHHVTSIQNYGIQAPPDPTDTADDRWEYASARVTSLDLGIEVTAPLIGLPVANAEAKVKVSFSREHSTAFKLNGARIERVSDEPALAKALVKLVDADEWEKDWLVVTEVVLGASGSVLVSSSAGASVELAVDADLKLAGLDVIGVAASPRVTAKHEMDTVMVNRSGLTALFRVKRVKRSWLTTKPSLRAAYATDELLALDPEAGEFADQVLEEISDLDDLG